MLNLPIGYFVLLLYYVGINLLIGFYAELFNLTDNSAGVESFLSFSISRFIINFAMFVGVPVFILSLFKVYLFPLTYHRHSLFSAFMGWLISLAVASSLGLGWFAILKYFGFSILSVDVVEQASAFLQKPLNLYLFSFPLALLTWGYPCEFFRAVLLGGGIRTNNPLLSSFLLIISSVAFGMSFADFGTMVTISGSVLGIFLGFYYLLRRSFWELVFLHTFILIALGIAAVYKFPML